MSMLFVLRPFNFVWQALSSWLMFGDATASELQDELYWGLRRPDSRANNAGMNLDDITIDTPGAFGLALNTMEWGFLQGHQRQCLAYWLIG